MTSSFFRVLAVLLGAWVAAWSGAALAQPGGGMPTGGMGGRGGPGGMAGMPNMGQMQMPTLEELIAPAPLFAWHNRLHQARGQLAMSTEQWKAFDAFLKDLGDVVKINERQVWRALGRSQAVVSARPDAPRDLKNLAAESREFANALEEFAKSHAALLASASAPVTQVLQNEYAQALRDAQNAKRKGPKLPGIPN